MDVGKLRDGFCDLKQHLRTLNVKYALLFQTKLKVISGTEMMFSTSPKEAWSSLEIKEDHQHAPLSRGGGFWQLQKCRHHATKVGENISGRSTKTQAALGRAEVLAAMELSFLSSQENWDSDEGGGTPRQQAGAGDFGVAAG
ncbi:hypothetical protein NDU88_008002 [Pleurodeles waltl]|uniref:Uncharacterized protein n=1 Tax=Pleurodeles waltl TaxID=8319 RepID=A0AAV7PMZ2_PLEWA|nr:hypothetical protein NDU88_008002 [Pleurodeles waltl]